MKRLFKLNDKQKREWESIKQEWRGIKEDTRKANAELKTDLAEVKAEQKRKEARRNPSMITRAVMATLIIVNVGFCVALAMSVIGIPVAIILMFCNVYAWMRWVMKRPTTDYETSE